MQNKLIGFAVTLFLAVLSTNTDDGGLFINTTINVPVTVINSK